MHMGPTGEGLENDSVRLHPLKISWVIKRISKSSF